ncbi:MAG: zf-TFIIB domain-containing protein [Dehalococcoidia bacterium]
MDCPRGHGTLVVEHHGGIEVDRCEACNGRWLDAHELDQLEATAAGEESRRGMIEYSKRISEMPCPKCGKRMTAFNYRANNLELDSCPDDHGYWLDAGETDRVVDLIEQRVRDLNRAASAEASWGGFVQKLRGDRKGGRFRR